MQIEKLHLLFTQSSGVCTDTRKLKPNQLFFALKGTNFDGNLYADKALQNAASYAVIDNPDYKKTDKHILVSDVLQTLQDLSTYHRQQLGIPIIGLTGSNGKTTTKELINSVLATSYQTTATEGNLNNHIGVPLTLLSMNRDTEIGIVEMGANNPGEIALLSEIAQPDYGYITNIGKAHLEGFKNLEGVLEAKTELYRYLQKHDKRIFLNIDDLQLQTKAGTENLYTFSQKQDADLRITLKSADPMVSLQFDNITIPSQLIGIYNATNIAAAVAIGTYFKISKKDIAKAITSYIPKNNRSQLLKRDKQLIIMDAYNANPTSMTAAITNLAQLEAKSKTAFLGDMFEVGTTTADEHQAILEQICATNVEQIFLIGTHFSKVQTEDTRVQLYNSVDAFIKNAPKKKSIEGTILIKGSRGMKLERLLDFL